MNLYTDTIFGHEQSPAEIVDRMLCMARLPLWLSYLLHIESLHIGLDRLGYYVEDKCIIHTGLSYNSLLLS